MITIETIDHVVLRASNVERMLWFYRDVLHCPVERELKDLGLIQLRAGHSLIDLVAVDSELGRLGGDAPQQNGRNMDHLCFRITAISESDLKQYLSAEGIDTPEFADRYGAQGHGRSVYVADPEGNVVELKLAID